MLILTLSPALARADDAGPSADTTSTQGCVEKLAKGAERPVMKDSFDLRGRSGYAATLTVTLTHKKAETVLPQGLSLDRASETAKELARAEFVLPDQAGPAKARLRAESKEPRPGYATTVLELPVVPLPATPGRHVLRLPPFPVTVARANGEVSTLCTLPHTITVEDPIASVPDARPQGNPPPLPQREDWKELREGLVWGSAGLLVGSLVMYGAYRWSKRPKPEPPPPPPRPPWEIALEALEDVRHAGLLETKRYGEYFDRVSDAVRGYLGARYGFDGLESTSAEILRALAATNVDGVAHAEIVAFLGECDLVKFANMTPTEGDCVKVVDWGETIVRKTMPRREGARRRTAESAQPNADGGQPNADGGQPAGDREQPAAGSGQPNAQAKADGRDGAP